MLALAPECGWTFAWSAPNSAQARDAGELLGFVDDEVAAVVALGRIALGVLVGEHRSLRGEDRGRGEVLRGDELDRRVLTLGLPPDDVGDLGVGAFERRHRARGGFGHRLASSFSISAISSSRLTWRPPSNSVVSHVAQDLVGERLADDPGADRQHVGVVVQPRVAGRVEIVAERGADSPHLVGRDLLALAAAAQDDPAIGAPRRDLARGRRAVDRVVHRLLGVGSDVDDLVPATSEHILEVLLEPEPGVVGTDGDLHPWSSRGSRHGVPRPGPAYRVAQLPTPKVVTPQNLERRHPRRGSPKPPRASRTGSDRG